MKILADSGSTKTDWKITTDNGSETINTQGINPTLMTEEAIGRILDEMIIEHPYMKGTTTIEFYGSGCTPKASPVMRGILMRYFAKANEVIVDSDIIGAAKALCGNNTGIACILGTGANSCLWNGTGIQQQTPAMGYILGDEGGGAVLGKALLNLLYKGGAAQKRSDGTLNPLYKLKLDFETEYSMTMSDVIERVYRQPNPNRWLASLSPFILKNISVEELHDTVIDNFRRFFRNNIAPYNRPDLDVSFVGSIAYHYSDLLSKAAADEGFRIGKIKKSPLD